MSGTGSRTPRLRNRIESLLADLPLADQAMTATEIARRLGARLSSVSSCLRRMVTSKRLVRVPGYGPRGGYGYRGRSMTEIIFDDMQRKLYQEIDRQVTQDLFNVTRGLWGV